MKKLKIEIKNRWTGRILFEYEKEDNTIKDTLIKAVKVGTGLRGADLRGADLGVANLRGANLRGADLREADLEGAYLYLDDYEINKNEAIKNIEANSNLKIKETYINRNVKPTRWNYFWKYGLIICDWEIKEPKKKMTVSEICEELGYEVEIVKEQE